jgi:glutamate-1-semialdehyde aminotransferase
MRRQIEDLRHAIEGKLTDKFLEILLGAMGLAFLLLQGFRRNLVGFSGRYLFRTADGAVTAGARFADGWMEILHEQDNAYDVAVTFNDPAALRKFLFSRDQDILASILANEVSVDGNLNYIYKFGFMARDLVHRLGVA